MILVCGILADPIIECVCARLADMQLDYLLLDEREFPGRFEVSWECHGSRLQGTVWSPDRNVNLLDVTGVYVRYVEHRGGLSPSFGAGSKLSSEEHSIVRSEYQALLFQMLELMPCTVMNRASASISNDSKIFQGFLATQFGFMTPKTLVTTNSAAAREFYEACRGDVIYKSLSSVRSVIRRLERDNFARLKLLANCPTQFQEVVLGVDIRAHVIGTAVFATEIISDANDYRYAHREGREALLRAIELPDDTAQACIAFTRSMGLEFSGIDLRRLCDGRYCCFEVNPSPGFLFYERSTGQPISRAVAELLARPSRNANESVI